MAYMIQADDCSACGTCEMECPNKAIKARGDFFVVSAEKCTECVGFFDEPQCVTNCASGAVVVNPDVPRSVA